MSQFSTITAEVDPSTRLALANLRAFLTAQGDFSARAINSIVDYVRREGCVDDGCPYLYPPELPAAEAVFAAGFIPVDYDDPAWGHLDGLDDPDTSTPDEFWAGRSDAVTLLTRPISGGEDIPAPYEPTPEDLADYEAFCRTADYLDGFNAARTD
jgi:hypothetical protein